MWTSQQEQGLRAIKTWFASTDQVFRFHGAAGTGKTTLLQTIAEDLGCKVQFAAYTGKAASVLRRKGCKEAGTIHQLIYKACNGSSADLQLLIKSLEEGSKRQPDGTTKLPQSEIDRLKRLIAAEEESLVQPRFSLNTNALADVGVLILDECSMIDERMEEHILSLRGGSLRVIASGDPFQLPPVRGAQGRFNERADYLLTEIHRQAQDSGILRLATDIREGRPYRLGSYGSDCQVVRRGLPENRPYALQADQILVGRNATRKDTNATLRRAAGLTSPLPVKGDRLICLQNNHDLGILNGTMWQVEDPGEVHGNLIDDVALSSLDTEGDYVTVSMHTRLFTDEPIPPKERNKGEHFTFGRAVTVHKSQGSQWDNVYMMEERGGWNHPQWLYTGITRAAKHLILAV